MSDPTGRTLASAGITCLVGVRAQKGLQSGHRSLQPLSFKPGVCVERMRKEI